MDTSNRKLVSVSIPTHERLTRRALALAHQRQRRTSIDYVITEALTALDLVGDEEEGTESASPVSNLAQ